MSLAEKWGFRIARRVPAAISPEAAGTRRADRDGVSVPRSVADTEGPRHGTRCWVAVEGVSARSERERASAEGPRARLAKQSRRAVKEKKPTAHPLGKTEPSRSEKTKHGRPPAGQENLHGVETKTGAHRPEGQTRHRGSGGLFHTNSPSVVEESLSLRGPEGAEAVPASPPVIARRPERSEGRRSNLDGIPPRGLARLLAASASAPLLRSGASR